MRESCNCGSWGGSRDPGAVPSVISIVNDVDKNTFFRKALWTGVHLQMTVMSIPAGGEIGTEIHEDTDQLLRVESGMGVFITGDCQCNMNSRTKVCQGDGIFIPAGTWHNVVNTGRCPLKLSSVYAPKAHPRGVVHRTKQEAEKAHDSCSL